MENIQRINAIPDVPEFVKPVTLDYLLKYNIICNPNFIFPGQVFVVPAFGLLAVDKSGARPYYHIRPGDSLWCLSHQLAPIRPYSYPIEMFLRANKEKIQDPNLIFPGTELLISSANIAPEELASFWKRTATKENCAESLSRYDYHYYHSGTFTWLAIGNSSIPYLIELLKLHCPVTRYFSAMALARIAPDSQEVISALQSLLQDQTNIVPYNQTIAEMAAIALERIRLVSIYGPNVHLSSVNIALIDDSGNFIDDYKIKRIYPKGTPMTVLHWHIPSSSPKPTEGNTSETQVYDYVRLLGTGETGFIKRGFNNEVVLV